MKSLKTILSVSLWFYLLHSMAEPGDSEFKEGVYNISTHCGKCIDIPGNVKENARPIIQYTCHGKNNQKWHFIEVEKGFYKIKSLEADKFLTVSGSWKTNGALIVLWEDLSADNQLFKVVDQGDGKYKLMSKHSEKFLEITEGWEINSAPLVQWEERNVKWQEFYLNASITPGGGKKLEIVSVKANGEEGSKEHPVGWCDEGDCDAQETIDGEIGGKSIWMWRKHNNERPWLVLDLGEAKTVEFLKIAFFKGHERNYNFDIQVSADNQDGPWKTVSKAISGGQTDRFEIFKTEELNGQYIRILGDGNSYKGPKDFAEWTNIYEIEVWGN